MEKIYLRIIDKDGKDTFTYVDGYKVGKERNILFVHKAFNGPGICITHISGIQLIRANNSSINEMIRLANILLRKQFWGHYIQHHKYFPVSNITLEKMRRNTLLAYKTAKHMGIFKNG